MIEKLKPYDTVIILNPMLSDEGIEILLEQITALIKSNSAAFKDIKLEKIGRKKLAYSIKGYNFGYYVLVRYYTTPRDSEKLDSMFKLKFDGRIIKHLTVEATEGEWENDLSFKESPIKQDEQPDAIDVLLGLAKYN